MKKMSLVAAVLAACCGTAFAANPFDGFRGHMKPGMYEYKMNMEMAGMPGGMGNHSTTMQRCVTEQDVGSGAFSKGERTPKDCEFVDVNQSGSTVTYKMVCKGQMQMTADGKVTVRGDGFVMDTKMNMSQGPNGQAMNMTQHTEAKYLGPCTK